MDVHVVGETVVWKGGSLYCTMEIFVLPLSRVDAKLLDGINYGITSTRVHRARSSAPVGTRETGRLEMASEFALPIFHGETQVEFTMDSASKSKLWNELIGIMRRDAEQIEFCKVPTSINFIAKLVGAMPKCTRCIGQGTEACPRCHGGFVGQAPCYLCNGTFRTSCLGCRGTGQVVKSLG